MKKINEKQPGRVRASVLKWLGVPVDLLNNEFWSGWAGGSSQAGQQVNEQTVLQIATVWACVRLISETISTLPLQVYEKTATGRRLAPTHAIADIIKNQPNADSTASVFWEAMIVGMLLRGNGFAEKKYIGTRLVALHFLKRNKLQITKDSSGRKIYTYTDEDGTQRVIPPSKIFRIPGFTIDGDWGVSAVAYGSGVFGSALAANNAANKTFENGMMPTIAFTLPGKVNPAQRDEFREMVKTKSGAMRAGDAVVLENGMTAASIGIDPGDAQLLESRTFSVEEICRWFRVPPFMVGHTAGSTNWGTGIEQQMIGFLTFTLRPWLKRIEDHIKSELMAPADRARFYVEFSVEGLLRADSVGRAEYLSKLTNNAIMTHDEAREKENLPPMGGNAAVLTIQSGMIPLDKLGEPTQ